MRRCLIPAINLFTEKMSLNRWKEYKPHFHLCSIHLQTTYTVYLCAKFPALLLVYIFIWLWNPLNIWGNKEKVSREITMQNLKDSDDGVKHLKLLGFWTLSIIWNSKY
jgi:hypothetical protein